MVRNLQACICARGGTTVNVGLVRMDCRFELFLGTVYCYLQNNINRPTHICIPLLGHNFQGDGILLSLPSDAKHHTMLRIKIQVLTIHTNKNVRLYGQHTLRQVLKKTIVVQTGFANNFFTGKMVFLVRK